MLINFCAIFPFIPISLSLESIVTLTAAITSCRSFISGTAIEYKSIDNWRSQMLYPLLRVCIISSQSFSLEVTVFLVIGFSVMRAIRSLRSSSVKPARSIFPMDTQYAGSLDPAKRSYFKYLVTSLRYKYITSKPSRIPRLTVLLISEDKESMCGLHTDLRSELFRKLNPNPDKPELKIED